MNHSAKQDFLTKLRVNYVDAPLLMDDPCPRFSWQMVSPRTGACQKAWRIRVLSDHTCCWDSGRTPGSCSVGIQYPETASPLVPETDYTWEVTVWDEKEQELHASSAFSTGFMGEDLSVWHGAQWIGSKDIVLAAQTLPVFRLQFEMQIEEGGSCAGIVFGANDPRLSSPTQNNYLIAGENYIAYRIHVDTIPAVVSVSRKGYAPGEEQEILIGSFKIPETILHAENRFLPHQYEIAVSGSQMEYMTIDGFPVKTGQENVQFHSAPAKWPGVKTQFILNPQNAVSDVPVFPRLNEIGFTTAKDTRAAFEDYRIRHYGGDKNVIFDEKTGATYDIFRSLPGLTADGNRITADAGILVYADPTFGAQPMLRRDFYSAKELRSARIYAACQGIFEMSLNGQKVGDEFLAPGDMDFRKRIVYTAYDVTEMVCSGENALGVILASGWFGDETSYTLSTYNFYGDRQAFLAVIALRYTDGTTDYVVSDGNWQYYGDGPLRYAANFNGETWDAEKEAAISGWDLPCFHRNRWTEAVLTGSEVCGMEPLITAKPDPGIRQTGELKAVFHSAQTRGTDTVYIYDMGINMVGIPQITFPKGTPGRKITIRYAEMLYPELKPDNPYFYGELGGMILTENLRGALVTDHYIMKGEENETFLPCYTFHGYRYVEISGIEQPIPAENIRGIVLSSVTPAARYMSSSPLANQLFENIIRSTTGNHLSIPTDCPQRDERLGWAGDANVYSETAVYTADADAFYSYFNQLQRDAQGKDGTYHLYAPSLADPDTAFALGYTWNAAGVNIPFELWIQYGDRKSLEDNYPHFRRHVLGMMQQKAPGYEYLTSHIGFVGDHLAVEPTDPSLMDNAQYYKVVRRVAETAGILGYTDDVSVFTDFADGLQKEWNEAFLDGEGKTRSLDGIAQDTQASYALPLMCGVFTEENKEKAVHHLEEACRRAGWTMTTGFMGTGSLLPALSSGGRNEAAYLLFEQKACPSWLYPVLNGATTVWERWNSYTIENGFGGQNGMNSFNHYSLGAVASWMIEYQAGIQRSDAPGFAQFILQPTPGGTFTQVKASYDSVSGTIESGWSTENGILTRYEAVVPSNTSAVLYLPVSEGTALQMPVPEGASYEGMQMHNGLPVAVFQLTSGRYCFSCTSVSESPKISD